MELINNNITMLHNCNIENNKSNTIVHITKMATDKSPRVSPLVIIPPLKTDSDLESKMLIIRPHTPPGEDPNTILKNRRKSLINAKMEILDEDTI